MSEKKLTLLSEVFESITSGTVDIAGNICFIAFFRKHLRDVRLKAATAYFSVNAPVSRKSQLQQIISRSELVSLDLLTSAFDNIFVTIGDDLLLEELNVEDGVMTHEAESMPVENHSTELLDDNPTDPQLGTTFSTEVAHMLAGMLREFSDVLESYVEDERPIATATSTSPTTNEVQ
jgi:hypothetical protein